MIAYIKGTLEWCGEKDVILETGGIGYHIFVSPVTLAKLPAEKEEVKLFTYFHVKDDGMSLYGFASPEELRVYHKLLQVSGIGPKGALGFLAQMTPSELVTAILSEDVKTLSQAPGIGKKTAQRVILELKDAFRSEEAFSADAFLQREQISTGGEEEKGEAIDALTTLGYRRSEAVKVVKAVALEGMTTEELLKAALKKMI